MPRIWECDFLPVIDLLFRPLYLLFIVELASRRMVHFGVTRSPTDAWVAQKLREARPYGETPRFLIRGRDRKYGKAVTRVATGSSIRILKTPYRAPRANAVCERFQGIVRRECTDHISVLGERHLYQVIQEYAEYFNQARSHEGIGQRIPRDPPRRRRNGRGGRSSPSRSWAASTKVTAGQPDAQAACSGANEVFSQHTQLTNHEKD